MHLPASAPWHPHAKLSCKCINSWCLHAPMCESTCRLAQATYKTPSTEATRQDGDSPSSGSFCFASPAADQPSPLATFLHQLSDATYEPQDSAVESPAANLPDAEAGFHSPDGQSGATPFQDFMKYLTQATYHSPGAKAGQDKIRVDTGVQGSSHADKNGRVHPSMAAADCETVNDSPGMLSSQCHLRKHARGLCCVIHITAIPVLTCCEVSMHKCGFGASACVCKH